jgi:hypothetical protein
MLHNYTQHPNGIIQQTKLFGQPTEYNVEYVQQRYDQYQEKTEGMSCLRLGYLTSCLGKPPKSILDVGYGNGSFLRRCSFAIPECYGHDISNYQLPAGCMFAKNIFSQFFTVITFFDSLEHFPDISFVSKLKCRILIISVPWCHNFDDEWFQNWKHRRPDEHLWHFNLDALINFMKEQGFGLLNYGSIEDAIRGKLNGFPNILTACFLKE